MVLMDLWLSVIILIVGLAILIKGSDFFVESAAFMARHFGVSELIIGLTLVSMGTSLPELGASVYASYNGQGGIAVGNVVGSNIANIALVLGVCLLFKQISVKRKMLKRDGLIMLGVSLLFTLFVFGGVARWEGLILMALFTIYIVILYKQNKDEKETVKLDWSSRPVVKKESSVAKEIAKLVIGCIGVFVGSKLLVDSASDIATQLSISETVIGSTLIAFGTSLPELAVSMTAILKKHVDISIGNIIGSNIFNILWVIGIAALINSLPVDDILVYTNIPIMLLVAAFLLMFMAMGRNLRRWQGGIFVGIYVLFLMMNYW
ncbi:MAG: calcium/sodium antiporter [Methanomassiliicoccales archaeon]|nr:MAG: calcium/sodium antiporter [Methanomassiliicoccales archaeon]